jgi:hypothetical protein
MDGTRQFVCEPLAPVLRHRRPEEIAAPLLQACAIRGRQLDVGVQIEAREVRVPRRRREDPGRVGVGPHTPDARSSTGTEGTRPSMEVLRRPAKARDSSRTGSTWMVSA